MLVVSESISAIVATLEAGGEAILALFCKMEFTVLYRTVQHCIILSVGYSDTEQLMTQKCLHLVVRAHRHLRKGGHPGAAMS